MSALFASLAALVVGPLVFERTRGAWALAALDAFALVAVGGLVSVHILPQCFQRGGWGAAPLLALGLFGPGLLCGSRFLSGETASRVTLPLALLGIAVHALLDGVALVGGSAGLEGLALAVVLHRVSDGLGIWWLARPAYGRRVALLLLGTLATFSVLGYVAWKPISEGASQSWFWLLQALVAGSLLHVILRHPPSAPREGAPPRRASSPRSMALASGAGALAGLALVTALEAFVAGDDHAHGGGQVFLELALRGAPALLAGYVGVAALRALALEPARALAGRSRFAQAARGSLAGLAIPVRADEALPNHRALVLAGVGAPAALAFLVSAGELSMPALLLSLALLGTELTLARALASLALALAVGLAVGVLGGARAARASPEARAREPLGARLARGLRYGFLDALDASAPWVLVGLGAAALLAPWLSEGGLSGVPAWLEVPLLALVGAPLYLCAAGATPLAAVLLAGGASPGAALAFLLAGPALDLASHAALARLHSRGVARLVSATAALGAIALGLGANVLLPRGPALGVEHGEHGVGALELASALVLLALFVASLLRQGARRFVGQVISPRGADDHHGHAHAHGPDDSGAPHDPGGGEHPGHGHEHEHGAPGGCGASAPS